MSVPNDEFEAVARDGWLEIRRTDVEDQWMAMDSPVDVEP